jgi:hypothetical protein
VNYETSKYYYEVSLVVFSVSFDSSEHGYGLSVHALKHASRLESMGSDVDLKFLHLCFLHEYIHYVDCYILVLHEDDNISFLML